ncbi:MAG: CotH kinase family protein [Microbacteriaceae bacterium]
MSFSLSRAAAVAIATTGALLFSSLNPVAPASAAVSYIEGTDPAAPIFNPLVVNDIDLEMSDEAIGNLTQEMCNGGEYQPATLTMTTPTATYGPMTVGVRLKGCWGSFRTLSGKAGFKVKINYVSGQTILGLKKLTLNNMVQDPSMLHEAVGYRVFRAMGVPAPRVGYTNVSLNGAEYGLHANIETLDKVSLPRWYGTGQTTHLYEGSYWMDALPDQVNNFEIDEGNTTRTDLTSLANANMLTGAAWWTAIQPLADLNEMTAMWATEFYLGHWDGYATRIWNNYYLHSTPAGKFSMLPWGLDQILSEQISYDVAADNGVMVKRCMAVTACKNLYAANLVRVRNTAKSLNLSAMTTAVGNAIDSSVLNDPRREVDYESSRWWRTQASSWLSNRGSSVTRWVTANTVGTPRNAVRRSGAQSVQSWSAPSSHGLTIDKYQVGYKKSGTWHYVETTSLSNSVTHPRGTTLTFTVRAHTVLGWGAWSSTLSITRP